MAFQNIAPVELSTSERHYLKMGFNYKEKEYYREVFYEYFERHVGPLFTSTV